MSNPVLNERVMKDASTTWAAPETSDQHFPPISDGPITPLSGSPRVMTVNGTISATAVLFVLLLVSAAFGWSQVETVTFDDGTTGVGSFPGLAMIGVIVGFGLAIFLAFKPHLAKFIAPLYAIAQGFAVGAISKAYESWYDGIVVQAAGATIAVFAVMLVLYRTRIIRVTEKMRSVIMTATIGVMVFYGISILLNWFGVSGGVSFINSPSLLGIGFSVLVAGLAAFNLLLDFDFIERGVEQRLEKNFEWYAGFGLLVTIVWLYLEMLRLLAKLRER